MDLQQCTRVDDRVRVDDGDAVCRHSMMCRLTCRKWLAKGELQAAGQTVAGHHAAQVQVLTCSLHAGHVVR